MSADQETPLIELVRDWFGDVEFDVDGANLALYASFVFLGVGLGAIFTVALITRAIGPEHVQGGPFAEEITVQVSPELFFSARDKVLIAAGSGFAVCNGFVLYTILTRGDSEVSEA